ncbi:hypothetical protein [Nitratireductor sp. XY-223]|uniref:hypothetical protein n=1 Tax=Nitratireductor sp. XY-223 TaxID=2561926 RepID=UPI0010A9DA25|nr:hypothetical protein [Nitratireductor sp. XY-223]
MANDAYEVYFAEKLWELIPGVYRDLDGREEGAGTLRALVEIAAREAAKIRRSQDHLWDDAFIELCDDWAIPYIGDLVATRMLSGLNPRGNRISVAKKVHYQRRSGTRPVLEELITDIAGYEGIVTEGFRRLARAWHRLDPPGAVAAGPIGPTPPGGLADLRSPRLTDLGGGPFDTFAYHPDIRRPGGRPMPGRPYATRAPLAVLEGGLPTVGIRKVGFHLYRLQAYLVRDVHARLAQGTTAFRFDPSGRDIPLFQVSSRLSGGNQGLTGTGFPDWREAESWEVPGPMICRVLGHADYVISEAALAQLDGSPGMNAGRLDQLRRLRGQRLAGEAKLRLALSRLPDAAFFTQTAVTRRIRAASLAADCGKAVLVGGSVSVTDSATGPLARERVGAAALPQWTVTAAGRRVVIDPERGRFRLIGAAPTISPVTTYAYGAPGPVGAGPYPRPEAAARDPDSAVPAGNVITAADIPTAGIVEISDSGTYDVQPNQTSVRDLVIQAAEGERPYLTRAANWTFVSAVDNAELVLDGLWIGGDSTFSVRLRGSFARVRIANCTIDPGGAQAYEAGSPDLPNIHLVVSGEVDRLEIDHSITGEISTFGSGQINRLVIRDSLVEADGASPAIALPSGEVVMERVSVVGDLEVHRLYATETLIDGTGHVRDNQTGCFRFGAYGEPSRLPKRYQSHAIADGTTVFTSRRFGDPGYGQISLAAPQFLRSGAEHGSEIGAFSSLNEPVRLEGLRQKAAEYMPFGLLPFFIAET